MSAADSPMVPVLAAFRRWRLIMAVGFFAALLAGLARIAMGRKYSATVRMATVVSPRLGSLAAGGLAATLLGGAASAGLQPTPPFVVQLAGMDGVINAVALSPAGDQTVIERLRGRGALELRYDRRLQAVRRVLSASFDRQTGTVTLTAVHHDSALARLMVNRLVDEVSRTFVRVSRAQAAELRRAQELRVDSAVVQLRRAERAMVSFLSANRQISPYSLAAVERESLQRQIDIAQEMYRQAVIERESAVAKELEETPAVVTLDAVPGQLPPVGRRVIFWAFVAGVMGVLLSSATVVLRAQLRANA